MSQQGGLVAELVNEMGINGQMANQMQMGPGPMQGQGQSMQGQMGGPGMQGQMMPQMMPQQMMGGAPQQMMPQQMMPQQMMPQQMMPQQMMPQQMMPQQMMPQQQMGPPPQMMGGPMYQSGGQGGPEHGQGDSDQGHGEPEPDEYIDDDEMPAPPRVGNVRGGCDRDGMTGGMLDMTNFGMNDSNKSWMDTIVDALKEPLIVALLFMILSSPQVSKLIMQFLPIIGNNLYYSLAFKGLLMGLLFFGIKYFL